MIKSLLIANRGEIAVRIIRTCKEMDIETVAVYSDVEKESLHVKMADKAVCIGPAASKDSYLNMQNIISAAIHMHCDAIHPGVGFLSENSEFAQEVRENDLIFIGAESDVIRRLGNKVEAKKLAEEIQIPIVPGSKEAIRDIGEALRVAKEIGLPVIIKAAAGGGGRGMRIVEHEEDLEESLQIASSEALKFFSDGSVYIEKYLVAPRHVEIQILGTKDNVIHLGERDCSVQKNHQKLIEESPSSEVSAPMREAMGIDAIRLFSHLNYVGAGTIEFLVNDNEYYFMEVNARVQVEHPVTELVTGGIDIIRQQILACGDESIDYQQQDIKLSGHSMECRINAISPGIISLFQPPLGPMVRVDTFIYNGYKVLPFYDSMIAKVIVHAPDRIKCIKRMVCALKELRIEGIKINVAEQLSILESQLFRSAKFGTDIYEKLVYKG